MLCSRSCHLIEVRSRTRSALLSFRGHRHQEFRLRRGVACIRKSKRRSVPQGRLKLAKQSEGRDACQQLQNGTSMAARGKRSRFEGRIVGCTGQGKRLVAAECLQRWSASGYSGNEEQKPRATKISGQHTRWQEQGAHGCHFISEGKEAIRLYTRTSVLS